MLVMYSREGWCGIIVDEEEEEDGVNGGVGESLLKNLWRYCLRRFI